MKILFKEDIKERKLRKDKEYFVLSAGINGTPNNSYYIILNDDQLVSFISISTDKASISDRGFFFNRSYEFNPQIAEVISDELPPFNDLFSSDDEWYATDFLDGHAWAITKFVKQLMPYNIEVSQEYQEIALNDSSKIYYVKGAMNSLFETACNFFGDAIRYKSWFDKHSKKTIDLNTLASISYDKSLFYPKEKIELSQIENWQLDLENNLYGSVINYSGLSQFIEKPKWKEYAENENGNLFSCLIQRIVKTIEAIFYEKEVIVHQLNLCGINDDIGQYCLIFESDEYFYRLYIYYFD